MAGRQCSTTCPTRSTATDDVILPSVEPYDAFTNSLKNQIEFYKQEHAGLRADVTALLEENQQLSNQLKAAVSASLAQDPPGECRRRTADVVANLQRQLLLVTQEKAAAMELYQTALKEVEALENELAGFRDNRHLDAAQRQIEEVKKEYSTAIAMLEEKIEDLKADLAKERSCKEDLEDSLHQARTERDRCGCCLREREQQLETALEGQTVALGKLEAMSSKVKDLAEEVVNLRRERDDLEAALTEATQRAEELGRREWAALARVEEALTLVDAALLEKDAALASELRAQEEVSRLQRSVEQVVEEAGKKVAEESTRLKQQFNSQLEMLLRDMRELQEELGRRRSQLEKAESDMKRLEDELEIMRKERACLPDPAQLQRNLENVYRELNRAELNNSELAGDRDRLMARLQQAEESHHHEMGDALDQLRQLRHELQTVRAQAEQAEATGQARALLLEEQVTKLEQQLNALQASGHMCIPDDQSHIQCEAQLEEYRRMLTQLNDMQQRGACVAQELQCHLNAQVEAKNKWQNEVKTLSARFEQRIDALREQLCGLKRANRNLERELAVTRGTLVTGCFPENQSPTNVCSSQVW